MAKTMNLGKVAMTTAGDYDSSKSYERLTCVMYNHVSWVSRKEVPAGIAPGTNDVYWQKVSERGAQGIQGLVGPQGNSAFDGTGVEIVNNLTAGGEAAVLSAEQGKILDAKFNRLSGKFIMLDGVKGVKRNKSIYNASGNIKSDDGYYVTSDIPVSPKDNISFVTSPALYSKFLILYDEDNNVLDFFGLYADKTKIALSAYPSVAYLRMTFKEGEGGSLSINGEIVWDNSNMDFSKQYARSSDLIISWIISESFTASNIVRDIDGNVESLDVTWCDGAKGKMTITRDENGNANSVTATYYGKTYALTITRDSEGNVQSTNIQ